MLAALERQREQIGQPTLLLVDTGYFSAAYVKAGVHAGIAPLMAMKRSRAPRAGVWTPHRAGAHWQLTPTLSPSWRTG
jgi:hypothetical protein